MKNVWNVLHTWFTHESGQGEWSRFPRRVVATRGNKYVC